MLIILLILLDLFETFMSRIVALIYMQSRGDTRYIKLNFKYIYLMFIKHINNSYFI